MEGDTLKGKFTRKDNNKVLTTTRALVGGELVQVSRSRVCFINNMQYVDLFRFNKCLHTVTRIFLSPAELQL